MSAASGNLPNRMNSTSDVDDLSMFQAMRPIVRRNAMADLGEQLAQGSLVELLSISFAASLSLLSVSAAITAAEMDNITPHFQTMSLKP